MDLRLNAWVDDEGDVVISLWRARLLRAVADEGSISAAAERLDVPYRVAWSRIHEMEQRLGVALVDATVGGRGGGGAVLTELGEDLVDAFERFAAHVVPVAEEAFEQEIRPRLP